MALNNEYRKIDFKKHPELYRIGRGEMGVLTAEPYKSELLPYWRFASAKKAKISAEKIFTMFQNYGSQQDFVGMDMARKFLQMGYTRSRRYANHSGGRKYLGPVPADKKGISGAHGRAELPRSKEDPEKAESARIFYSYYKKAMNDTVYLHLKSLHKERYQ